jgi:hypothetical protein
MAAANANTNATSELFEYLIDEKNRFTINKFINTLNSGYREKIVKPLAIIDRGARRGIVNSDVATRQLLRQIKNPNDIALKKYVLRPLSEVQNKATRAVKRAVIDGIILPVNYADRAIKQTLIDTDSQILFPWHVSNHK